MWAPRIITDRPDASRPNPQTPAKEDREERHADERGDDPDRQLGRSEHRAGRGIGQHGECSASEEDSQQETAVERPNDRAERVWHHQPDEPDHSGRGDARGGEDGGRNDHEAPGLFNIDAEHGGRLVPEGQAIERA